MCGSHGRRPCAWLQSAVGHPVSRPGSRRADYVVAEGPLAVWRLRTGFRFAMTRPPCHECGGSAIIASVRGRENPASRKPIFLECSLSMCPSDETMTSLRRVGRAGGVQPNGTYFRFSGVGTDHRNGVSFDNDAPAPNVGGYRAMRSCALQRRSARDKMRASAVGIMMWHAAVWRGRAGQVLEIGEFGVADGATATALAADHRGPQQDGKVEAPHAELPADSGPGPGAIASLLFEEPAACTAPHMARLAQGWAGHPGRTRPMQLTSLQAADSDVDAPPLVLHWQSRKRSGRNAGPIQPSAAQANTVRGQPGAGPHPGVAWHRGMSADDCVFAQSERSSPERQLPRKRLREKVLLFFADLINTRTGCVGPSKMIAFSRTTEWDKRSHQRAGNETPHAALRVIKSAAESEIGPTYFRFPGVFFPLFCCFHELG